MEPISYVTITDYTAFANWLLSTTTVTDVRFWDRIGGFFNLTASNGRLLDLSRRAYVHWNLRVHGHFSELCTVGGGVERTPLFRALTLRAWNSEPERVLRTIRELRTEKLHERGDYWGRNLEYMCTNILAETPEPIFRTLCHTRIIPELKRLVTTWKVYITAMYAGRHDDLVLQVTYFIRRSIEVDRPLLEFIGELKHSCSLPISRKMTTDKTFHVSGFITTTCTKELDRDDTARLVHRNGTGFETVVDRIVWGATMWWYRRTYRAVESYDEFWYKYCGWMDTPTGELPDE
ncbi:ORF33 [Ictalurid herpesvirus 1]|uniref:Uncharacterized protein ORF33 n=1 Tax=Ictalurid herpesvirus 1 (strain Auburn) TaxID=766178 RepID=VG33_ICHVA|nr:ORF33 [Ictalurid herpesvirus 1]Q00118.1 RecName: Full=Uncharacterized protein ORF33 [Ictalurid herpesvirus 1 (strain Auburn)]AAA88136.1 ORF33 [Ictalurid herpesvirus 1]